MNVNDIHQMVSPYAMEMDPPERQAPTREDIEAMYAEPEEPEPPDPDEMIRMARQRLVEREALSAMLQKRAQQRAEESRKLARSK